MIQMRIIAITLNQNWCLKIINTIKPLHFISSLYILLFDKGLTEFSQSLPFGFGKQKPEEKSCNSADSAWKNQCFLRQHFFLELPFFLVLQFNKEVGVHHGRRRGLAHQARTPWWENALHWSLRRKCVMTSFKKMS